MISAVVCRSLSPSLTVSNLGTSSKCLNLSHINPYDTASQTAWAAIGQWEALGSASLELSQCQGCLGLQSWDTTKSLTQSNPHRNSWTSAGKSKLERDQSGFWEASWKLVDITARPLNMKIYFTRECLTYSVQCCDTRLTITEVLWTTTESLNFVRAACKEE